VFTGDMLAGRFELLSAKSPCRLQIGTHLMIRTLCSFRCRWRLQSQRWLFCLRESTITLTIPEVLESSRDVNNRLRCIVLRI
jgi:hypothetical protein